MTKVIANRVERIVRPFEWIVLSSALWYTLNSLFFIFYFYRHNFKRTEALKRVLNKNNKYNNSKKT